MLTWQIISGEDRAGVAAARSMFREYEAAIGIDLCFQGFSEELAGLPGKYGSPDGVLFLVYEDDALAACGALRPLEDGICELKRIYVRPAFRRRGLARTISMRLLQFAEKSGYAIARLDTLRRLTGAVELYESLGFSIIEPYNFNPEADIVYMEKEFGKKREP